MRISFISHTSQYKRVVFIYKIKFFVSKIAMLWFGNVRSIPYLLEVSLFARFAKIIFLQVLIKGIQFPREYEN